jgi:hypothetical protein
VARGIFSMLASINQDETTLRLSLELMMKSVLTSGE